MATGEANGRLGRVLRCTFGGALCLLAAINVLIGSPWYLSVGIAVIGTVIILGRRRIFRAGVSRTADDVVCRYIPWFEGNVYALNLLIPLLAVTFIAAGYAPGYPVWLRFGGMFLLAGVTPLMVYAAARMWRRCILRITPSVLSVRLAVLGSELIEIPRDVIQSITPKIVPNGVSGQWLQVEIAYHAADLSSDTTKTVLLGLQLSVEPTNLLDALLAWKDATTDDDPGELLDRIERILRGHSTAAV